MISSQSVRGAIHTFRHEQEHFLLYACECARSLLAVSWFSVHFFSNYDGPHTLSSDNSSQWDHKMPLMSIKFPDWQRSLIPIVYQKCETLHESIRKNARHGKMGCCNGEYGYAVAQLVQVLRYNPEGRGIDSRWDHWLKPSGRNMVLGSTQSLTGVSTTDISWW
jgi:hypothetical protein